MDQRRIISTITRILWVLLISIFSIGSDCTSCTVPNPNYRPHVDAASDSTLDGSVSQVPLCTANQPLRCDNTNLVRCNETGTAELSESCSFGCNPTAKACASKPGPVCTANQPLRCDGTNLVRCNADGTGDSVQPCTLGCDVNGKRCFDMLPSNGLRTFLGQSGLQPNLNLGDSATVNTDTGDITVGGAPIGVKADLYQQPGAPTIRALIVGSFTCRNVTVIGKNALAVVSSGPIVINGTFMASAYVSATGFYTAGAGAFSDGSCKGSLGDDTGGGAIGGNGGNGYGSPGGSGGSATNTSGFARGGAGGTVTGNAQLVPLRGGCGDVTGGGAIHLVSGTRIAVSGMVAANGLAGDGGGSGGGILIEAPVVEVSGLLVANGGAGDGRGANIGTGEDGRLDTTPARGGMALKEVLFFGAGGNGSAGNFGATNGESISVGQAFAGGGHGGGGVGRIRINTASGSQVGGGTYSPFPTFGALARQ